LPFSATAGNFFTECDSYLHVIYHFLPSEIANLLTFKRMTSYFQAFTNVCTQKHGNTASLKQYDEQFVTRLQSFQVPVSTDSFHHCVQRFCKTKKWSLQVSIYQGTVISLNNAVTCIAID